MMHARTLIAQGMVHTLCRQCDHHCGIWVHIEHGRIVKISGNFDHPENQGMLCPKGRVIPEWVYHPARLTGCLKRTKAGRFEPIVYEQAVDEIAEKIRRLIADDGLRAMSVWTGEAIGFLQQEEYARRFIHALGSPNFFTADSVCFASRLMGYTTCQGYWSLPPDFRRSRLTILWGANPGYSHLPYMRDITRARREGGALVVVDPRLSVTARKADLFLQIRPGTDAALALGLIRLLIEREAYDTDFVKRFSIGFEELAAYAQSFTPAYVAQQTGVVEEDILRLHTLMLQHLPQVVNYIGIALEHQTNGFNTIRAIACLSALCGAVDIAGGDPWNMPFRGNSLAVLTAEQFRAMEPVGYESVPLFYEMMGKCHSLPGLDAMLGTGTYPIKGLIFSGTNPMLSNPNSAKVGKAFANLELLVARDLFLTESAKLAHYIIPAASFLERSELHVYPALQRVALSTKVLEVEGVWDEYTFWHDLAHRLGFGERYFPWPDEEAVTRWILEPTGISLDDLRQHPEGCVYLAPVEYRKFARQPLPTASGKFEFRSAHLSQWGYAPLPVYVPPDYLASPTSEFPFRLISGTRKPIYYHSRYREIEKFRKAIPAARAEIHPDDANRLGIRDGEMIRIVSKIGKIEVEAEVVADGRILPGFIEVPHGWNVPNVNRLTDDRDVDPVSGFPNMKIVPVTIEKID
ncbi:molybdopterin-dependent oxidoreductase [candidate division KSB3 bacterium]|uniref:Molybdopterin-dependent oxidoreductase n=1 Tax=candidate division KSB3 bacterium TaxID=2044937 RepID=A0A9D5JZG0_9BACT|nr:molybdopterin-dependent oxidoreductase [candidate division KSB3 bacterium]MBD3326811.1 molybdopterin-dependent oxidoreductase [candidate division KSB3 bacterium]